VPGRIKSLLPGETCMVVTCGGHSAFTHQPGAA
jgi:hypothetical protein